MGSGEVSTLINTDMHIASIYSGAINNVFGLYITLN